MTQRKFIIGLLSLLLLGCGQQGALYLPESTSPETKPPETENAMTDSPAADKPAAAE